MIVTLLLMKSTYMKLQRIILLIFGFGFLTLSVDAQKCGTEHDTEFMARLDKTINHLNQNPSSRKVEDTRYVPVKFHLIANSQGLGRIPESLVYTQLCRLNEQYDSMGFLFYIDEEFSLVNNTVIYEHSPSSSARSQMAGLRNQNPMSVNVFVTNATHSEGVAGYYTGGADFLVVAKPYFDEVDNGTLGHELAHLFSLAHPHVGWEDNPYNPQVHGETVTITSISSSQTGSAIEVELMNELNCTTAADRVCDTPPDYGFTQNGDVDNGQICHNPWEGVVKDRNGVLIYSIPNTIMGYNSCDEVIFTHGQANVIRANYDLRTNINKTFVPDTTQITEAISTIEPVAFSTTEYYNEVLFDWTEVDGAHSYVLELSGTASFSYETTESEFVVTDLAPGASYTWRVFPTNDIGSCQAIPDGGLFFTSSDEVSSVNDIDIVSNVTVHPNPVVDQEFTLSFESANSLDAKMSIYDLSGKAIINNVNTPIRSGKNLIPVQLNNAATGLYNLIIRTSEGIITEKLIIK